MTLRRGLAAAVAGLLGASLLLPAVPAGAQRKNRFGAAVAPIRLVPTSRQPIDVAGLHGFFGTVELGSFGDGLAVINDVQFEKYLLGLNEVPVGWPVEALRAQAIAARTYALWTLNRPRAGSAAVYGFDICATVQCQVFSGADVVSLPDGERWTRAVRSTEGMAILYAGAPILARYHSTSGGATLDNPQAFPTERAYPYLQGVPSTTEERAPLYRWRVEFTLGRMRSILERAGIWQQDFGRLLEVRTRPSRTGLHYPDVVFVGRRGRTFRTAEELRDVVRDLAPAMFPGLYPSPGPTASGRLPETFPSNRLRITTRGRTVRVVGRGWGHGVGMSQWGAEGLARRGYSHVDILSHYYTGVTVGPHVGPGRIRVGTATGLPSASVTGAFKIVDGRGQTLAREAIGTWSFRHAGSGAIEIEPPKGHGLPLRLGVVEAPERVRPGRKARFTITLSRPAKVRVVTQRRSSTAPIVKSAGRRQVAWQAPRQPGEYTVRVHARGGSTERRSDPVRVVVRAPPEKEEAEATPVEATPEPEPRLAATAPQEEDGIGALGLIALAAIVAVAVATGVLAAKIDRWAKQPRQP